jgi:hypothetical protein
MAWDTTLVNRLRFYIHDIDASTQSYTDSTLAKYLAISVIDVASDVYLIDTTFTVNTDDPSISPDPTSSSVPQGIANLFVLRAAMLIAMGEMRRDVAKYGIKVKDDMTSYDATGAMKGRAEVFKSYEENYQKTKWEWEKGNKAAGKAILGPYSSADNPFYADSPNYFHGRRTDT